MAESSSSSGSNARLLRKLKKLTGDFDAENKRLRKENAILHEEDKKLYERIREERKQIDDDFLDARGDIQKDLINSIADLKNKSEDFVLKKIGEIQHVSFYKDRNFWSGVCAFPLLITLGWGVDYAFNDGLAKSYIHRVTGVKSAIEFYLGDRNDEVFQNALKYSFENLLSDQNTINIREKLISTMSGTFVKEEEFAEAVKNEFLKYGGVIHAAILRIGVLEWNEESKVDCKTIAKGKLELEKLNTLFPDGCPLYENIIYIDEKETAFAYSMNNDLSVEIAVAAFTKAKGYGDASLQMVAKDTTEFTVTFDNEEIMLSPESLLEYKIEGENRTLRHFTVNIPNSGDNAQQKKFPIHFLKIKLSGDVFIQRKFTFIVIVRMSVG